MDSLKRFPNISTVIAQKLRCAGIHELDELRKLGSKKAFFKVRVVDPSACVNLLYSLEGAVQGGALAHSISCLQKDLKTFHHSL